MKKFLIAFLLVFITLYANESRKISLDENGNLILNTLDLMDAYKSFGLNLMLSFVTLPDGVKIVETAEKTLNIETNQIKLDEFELFAQTTLNVKQNGFIVVNIKLSDEKGNLITQSSLDIAKAMNATLLKSGDLTSTFELNGLEITFYAYKSGEVKLQIKKDGEVREFNAPIDSKTLMQEDGSFISKNEFSASDGTLNSEIITKANGEIFAKAINSKGESFELTPPKEASEVNVELIQSDLLSEFKSLANQRVLNVKSIKSGGLKSTYSVRKEFSLKDYFARSVNVESGSDVLVVPDGEIKCIQNSNFDGKKSVILIDGKADIIVDGKSSEMKLNEEYIVSEAKVKSLNLIKGWNLVAIPVAKEVNSSIFEHNIIWTYKDDNWSKNSTILNSAIGFWINSKAEANISFIGSDYKPNFVDLNGSWKLLGTGQTLKTLKTNWNFKNVWSYKNTAWEENPAIINDGDGFWVLP